MGYEYEDTKYRHTLVAHRPSPSGLAWISCRGSNLLMAVEPSPIDHGVLARTVDGQIYRLTALFYLHGQSSRRSPHINRILRLRRRRSTPHTKNGILSLMRQPSSNLPHILSLEQSRQGTDRNITRVRNPALITGIPVSYYT